MARGTKTTAHPYIPELTEALRTGAIDRRGFLRTATLLGLSATSAYALAGGLTGDRAVPRARAETPRKGGNLRISMKVQEMADPARFDWTEKSNVARQVIEYLTVTGPDNVTRPYLAERWEASEDLKTWTFHLRRGVKWSNGDDFDVRDVAFNLRRWVGAGSTSANKSLFAGLSESGIEAVDAHTIRLHLDRAVLSLPENFYNYPTGIVHRRFEDEGANLAKSPVGTGPYALGEFAVGEKAVLEKRPAKDYWGEEVLLDRITYVDHGDDPMAGLAAIASRQVDLTYEISPDQLEVAEKLPGAVIFQAQTAQTAVARFQLDRAPFDDRRIRRAIQACMDHPRLLEIGYRGRGAIGEDHHVAPIHPEYAALAPQKQDYALARKLLEEAGKAGGLDLALDCRAAPTWEPTVAQVMAEMLRPANIRLRINVMPSEQYGEIWNKTAFGLTAWAHRPLAVMALNLAYRSGGAWNESHYANPAFDKALDQAMGSLDLGERRRHVETCERLLQGDAVFVQPLWRAIFAAGSDRVQGFRMHPTNYHQLGKVWLA